MQGWQNFYSIVGEAGATLIGVQFIVITLIATIGSRPATGESVAAFGTPTVVHFTGAVVISAIMSAPWPSLTAVSVAVMLWGIYGFGYAVVVIRRAHRQTVYAPEREDWLWYAILPCVTYAALFFAGIVHAVATGITSFVIAAAAVALLLIGIHNSWDTVTYIVLGSGESSKTE